jgi:eukaryotic-like serine/threonine-protein kinase
MNPNREAAWFELVLAKPPAERTECLKLICGEDETLRQRLKALLAAHEQSEGVLPEPAPAARATMKLELADIPDETVGQKIGRYKILEKFGEGGCGVIYVTEQTEPVRRRVALKVTKLGMDTKQIVARFVAERLRAKKRHAVEAELRSLESRTLHGLRRCAGRASCRTVAPWS